MPEEVHCNGTSSQMRGTVRRYLEEGRVNERAHGGQNHVKVDEEMRRCIAAILDENPVLTLDAINTTLRERLPQKPHVHSRTIGKILDGMLYTVKLVRRCPAERNRPDVIQSRRQYAAWFLEEAIRNQVVFVDECGFNIWTARSQGRALRGERAYRQVAGQRGNNITITLAVSSTFGLVHHSMHIGGTNQARFQAFLQECAENLPENETTIIFDGALPHRPAQTSAEHIELQILPPYLPFLNIVENAISALKAIIKGDISRPMVQQQINDRLRAQQENIPLGEYRKRVLLAAAERTIATITVPHLLNIYNLTDYQLLY